MAADGIAALEGRLAAKASLLAENTAALEAKVAAITAPVAADKEQQVAAHTALQVGGEQGHRAGVPYGCSGLGLGLQAGANPQAWVGPSLPSLGSLQGSFYSQHLGVPPTAQHHAFVIQDAGADWTRAARHSTGLQRRGCWCSGCVTCGSC